MTVVLPAVLIHLVLTVNTTAIQEVTSCFVLIAVQSHKGSIKSAKRFTITITFAVCINILEADKGACD